MTWKKGQSGNPAGSKPNRNKVRITDAFLRALSRDFKEHGEMCIIKMREEDNTQYIKMVAQLLPKESHVDKKVEHEHHHTHESISSTLDFIEGAIRTREDFPHEESVQDRPVLSS